MYMCMCMYMCMLDNRRKRLNYNSSTAIVEKCGTCTLDDRGNRLSLYKTILYSCWQCIYMYLFSQSQHVGGGEGRFESGHLVEDAASCPNVNLLRVWLILN